jgi:hypothetical protein
MNRTQSKSFLKSRRKFAKGSFVLISSLGLGSFLLRPILKKYSSINKFPKVTQKNGWVLLKSDIEK